MEGLGIDPIQLGAQIINFTIIVFVLKKFLYTPILTMIDKRRAEIKEGLQLKDKMAQKSEELDAEQKKLRMQLRAEEHRIMKQVVDQAKSQGKELIDQAKREIENEREKMLVDLSREREKMLDQVKKQSLDYAVLISEKLLGKKIDMKEHNDLINEAIENLEQKHEPINK